MGRLHHPDGGVDLLCGGCQHLRGVLRHGAVGHQVCGGHRLLHLAGCVGDHLLDLGHPLLDVVEALSHAPIPAA